MNTACKFTGPEKSVPSNCATITANTVTYTGSAWPTPTYKVTSTSGKYITSNDVASPTCAAASKGYFVDGANATAQTPCGCGSYQPSTGQASCKTTDAGYYAAGTGNIEQTKAGVGKYAKAGACSATACAPGLTTIGYGTGADEVGDCGRKLHLGDNVLYLRNVKKTTPSLRFDTDNDGIADLFGNMSTTSHKMSDGATKSYKTTYNGSTYYIYDDSAQ